MIKKIKKIFLIYLYIKKTLKISTIITLSEILTIIL